MQQKLLEREKSRIEFEEERNRLKLELNTLQNNFSLQKYKDRSQLEFEQARRKELEEEVAQLHQLKQELSAVCHQVAQLQEEKRQLKQEIKQLHLDASRNAVRANVEASSLGEAKIGDFMQVLMQAQKVTT